MIKISNITIPAKDGTDKTEYYALKKLKLKQGEIKLIKILKLSIDSRKKPEVYRIVTAAFDAKNEASLLKRFPKEVSRYTDEHYEFPYTDVASEKRPVIVGFGPAGMFAALTLTEAGLSPIVIERGKNAEARTKDVESFWKGGELNTESNVQFGEGGAGLFSDGKLTTGIGDKRIEYVFRRFIEFGANNDISYLSKPHIGTDVLKKLIKNLREYLISNGCEIRFETRLTDISIENEKVKSVTVEKSGVSEEIETDALILGLGNSARDTFRMLHSHGISMEPKSFAVGVRLEHLQSDIDMAQYGEAATLGTLPASDYKLAVHKEDGRGIFTFCVCPGGYVVAATSEKGHVVTNGMSEYARDNVNINGGLLVSVDPKDFDDELFGGIEFQQQLEKSAYSFGGEDYSAPCQLVGDFLSHTPSVKLGKVKPSYSRGVKLCNLWDVLPAFICEALEYGLKGMEKKIKGFSDSDAVLTAVETRSSCPIRILRNTNGQSSVSGIFPCGEGAGYAGGITSASVDGIKAAENVCVYLDKLIKYHTGD